MLGFKIVYSDFQIRFRLYSEEAPITVNAFVAELPFIREFMHARVSGQEIWTDKGLGLNIIQENASVFTIPGEVVLGPSCQNEPAPLIVSGFIMAKAGAWIAVIFLQKFLTKT